MKILIITTRFFPNGSATSVVVGNLAEALRDLGCDVHIVAMTRFKEDAVRENWRGISVRKVFALELITKEQFRNEWKKSPGACIKGIGIKIANRVLQKISSYCRGYSLDYSLLRKYRNAIGEELKNEYDLCLATLMPIEAVVACDNLQRNGSLFGIYQLDPFWNNDDLPSKLQDERFRLETGIILKSDFCMTTPIINNINSKRNSALANKYISVEFPCLKEIRNNVKPTKEDDYIHAVFLGTLYPSLRPPERLVEIISKIRSSSVSFDFYGSGQDLIRQSMDYEAAKSRIKLLGQVTSSKAEEIRDNADVLINIDNTSTVLVPSKVFEYVSTGLPIINCYFSKESHVLEYLYKYPRCLNIYLLDKAEENAAKIEEFLAKLSGDRLPFEEIKELYIENTPEYVAGKCLDTIKKYKATK